MHQLVPDTELQPTDSLLGQRLLLVDADVEVHRLHPEQHAALDLPRQGVEYGRRQRDSDVEAVSVPGDDGQQVGSGAAGGLRHLKEKQQDVWHILKAELMQQHQKLNESSTMLQSAAAA